MPVYNAGEFLVESLQSVVNQTYKNWELIAVDDKSTDNSLEILKEFAKQDRRIRVFRNKKQKHVAATSSFALTKCRGEFIARMDADDISMPRRFEKQVAFLQKHTQVVMVGGQCEIIDRDGNMIGYKKFPLTQKEVYKMIFRSIPVQQPSVMINRTLLPKDFVWYDKRFSVAEEVELIFKMFQFGKIRNMPEVLLKYRIHGNNVSLVHPKKTFYMTLETRLKAIRKYGYRPDANGIVMTIAQTVVVTALPESLIYPVYSFVRGLKTKTAPFTDKLVLAKVRI
jgi:glycosyltransferase involved in cell wall biosynthesis